MSCSVSSARDWNFWSDSVYEGPAMKHKENAVHAKLVAWKDSQIVKLIYKLNQKDRWQKNKIARPGIRDELTETEEQEQGRLPTREDLVKCFSMPRNIRLQTPRHPSLPDMRVDGSNRGPPKFVHKATPARLMRRARSSHNYHGKHMEAIDAVNEWRLPKVSEEEDEAVDQKGWQDDTMSCRVSSARDWNFGSDSVYEGPAMKHKENAVHAKLVAWKDAQVSMLIDKLKAQIDEWQKNKFAWAKDKLAKTEKKLEKQRTETVVKMQKAIEDAERKDDMKSQEEAAAKSKIAGFERALQMMPRAGRQADCQILLKGPYTV
ncbi:uncharacterized protein [Triticum aestivum]|uniref:uncharacterized protein isoform X2 n=1 Tax=Triticum aestivum TaxID=4565 RepID=UPI001D034351|nr:uncharacterized protein LOC123145661 isoform X2 [Triticum aestivum]